MIEQNVDVLIVGGGLVGSSLALALQPSAQRAQPLRVALVEAAAGGAAVPPGFDERNLALARGSLESLQRLGVLQRVARAPESIRHIHVSRRGDFGSVRIGADEHAVDALGGVIMACDLGAALESCLAASPALQRWVQTRVTGMRRDEQGWCVDLDGPEGSRSVHTRLLVGADGTGSAVREALGIGAQVHDYGQDLFVCALEVERLQPGTAWERFTDSGPVALLPRNDGRLGAVCGVAREQADDVAALDDLAYCDYLQQRFGFRAGRFRRVGRRVRYPLHRVCADRLHGDRGVLLGNAAQTIHPIGAQGFNLGLRDALQLSAVLDGVADPGDEAVLQAYAAARDQDRARTLETSHGLARLTANRTPTAHLLRSLGLLGLGHAAALRAPMVAASMGYPQPAFGSGGGVA